ncbi:LolA-related protein [Luteimonas sp. RIT-PG2_3]
MVVATIATTAMPRAASAQQSIDAGWILTRLARPAPDSTPFLEVRDSPMLKAPLRMAGEYRRPDSDTLVREVRTPYAETTTIRAGEAVIARAGRAPRRFSLARAPELASLQSSFGALLSGDDTALRAQYHVSASGHAQAWTLVLAPRDAAIAAKLRDITLRGRGDELRCIETRPVKGELQRTLMAGAARAASPDADGAALAVLCHGGGQS